MDETELITELHDLLDSILSIPVRTGSIENERPVPVAIIDSWNTQDFNFNNSPMAGEAYGDFNDDGNLSYEKYLNFSYETRVEFLFRHTDEVEVSRIKEKAKEQFRIIRENPFSFNDNLKNCEIRGDGEPRSTFVEQRESELMLAVRFHGDHTITRTASDMQNDPLNHSDDEILDSVIEQFTFTC